MRKSVPEVPLKIRQKENLCEISAGNARPVVTIDLCGI